MNNTMTSTSQFKDLNEFLAKHSAKNEKTGDTPNFTHTRMPDKDLNIYPGSYIIPKETLPIFHKLYYESNKMFYQITNYNSQYHVTKNNYLTDIEQYIYITPNEKLYNKLPQKYNQFHLLHQFESIVLLLKLKSKNVDQFVVDLLLCFYQLRWARRQPIVFHSCESF